MKSLHWKKNDPKAKEPCQKHQLYSEPIRLQELCEQLEKKRKRIKELEEREQVLRIIIRNQEELLSRITFTPISFDRDDFPESSTSNN